MSQITPDLVIDYVNGLRGLPHPQLDVIAAAGRAQGLPIVDQQTGALLHLLTHVMGATRVLEIGTAIGYSGLWIASALPINGMLITLERDQSRAAEARSHFEAAGVAARVSVMIGDASRYLHKVSGPFDLVFQDGDKAHYAAMFPRLMQLLRPGGLLVTDNVLWSGEVVPGLVHERKRDAESTQAVANYNQLLARDGQSYTTILPVGDGVALTVKRA
jgi:predicted O-methyltransferase YrrM